MTGPAQIVYFLDKEKDLVRGMRIVTEGAFPCQGGAVTEFFRLPCGHFIRVAQPTGHGLGIGNTVFDCSGIFLVTGSACPHRSGAVHKLVIDNTLVAGITGGLNLNLLTLRSEAQLLLMAWAANFFIWTGMESICRIGGRGRVKLL